MTQPDNKTAYLQSIRAMYDAKESYVDDIIDAFKELPRSAQLNVIRELAWRSPNRVQSAIDHMVQCM